MTIRSKAASSPLLKWTSKRHNKAEKPKNSRIRNGPGFSAPDGAAPLSHGRICSEFPVIQRMLHYSTARCFSLFATETICTYRAIWLRGRFLSVTQKSTSRFCWAGKCGYSYDFLELITKHDGSIVLLTTQTGLRFLFCFESREIE